MLLPFQDAWLRSNCRVWTESPLDNLLYVTKSDLTPEKLAVLLTWTNLAGIGDDGALRHPRCACGRTMGNDLMRHDCFCYDCWQTMVPKKTWTPEMGYADEIYSCPRCGKWGASRSFIQTPV